MTKKLTKEEWKELGNKLKLIRDVCHNVRLLLKGRLPESAWHAKWLKTIKWSDRLRNSLENAANKELTNVSDEEFVGIFFGDNK